MARRFFHLGGFRQTSPAPFSAVFVAMTKKIPLFHACAYNVLVVGGADGGCGGGGGDGLLHPLHDVTINHVISILCVVH